MAHINATRIRKFSFVKNHKFQVHQSTNPSIHHKGCKYTSISLPKCFGLELVEVS